MFLHEWRFQWKQLITFFRFHDGLSKDNWIGKKKLYIFVFIKPVSNYEACSYLSAVRSKSSKNEVFTEASDMLNSNKTVN